VSGLVENRRDRLRIHMVNKINRTLELRSRIEWSLYKVENQRPATGYLAFQEAVVKPLGSRFSGVLRYTIFDTRDYDSRIYAFENDLFAAGVDSGVCRAWGQVLSEPAMEHQPAAAVGSQNRRNQCIAQCYHDQHGRQGKILEITAEV
jgi:hypothetical protein